MDSLANKFDPHSFSNPEECIVTDIKLNLLVNFEKKILSGSVDLFVERKILDVPLFLDTRDLVINHIIDVRSQEKLKYVLSKAHKFYGSELKVLLPVMPPSANRFQIRIEYETLPCSSSLTWLDPIQTAGKKLPYVFSHNEAINARAMLPCQDTPGVKTPYSAKVTAASDFVVLMSAIHDGEEKVESNPSMKSYMFVQKIPIPSYLIAIAVGALESRKIGPRSHVWSEKEFVDEAAEEFSETEQMICAAETLLGYYVWEVYDILVLPPCFSFGGMENPCLTFVSSTLLAGDKSNITCVIHEISHSWTGNLVTFKSFEHFWLNEGFTTYIERKIQGILYGQAKRHFLALGRWKELQYKIDVMGKDNPLTNLVPNLTEKDPYGDAFGIWSYEKGHTLLFYLEEKLGTEEFDIYLKSYIEKYKLCSINTNDWLSYLYEFFSEKRDILDGVNWEAWLYTPGMPPEMPNYDSSYGKVCNELCETWIKSSNDDLSKFSWKDLIEFSSLQITEFLELLLSKDPLSLPKVEKMREVYELGKRKNAEILSRWIRLGLRSHYKEIVVEAVRFVSEVGRLKFVDPIYRELFDWKDTRDLAISTYNNTLNVMMYDTKLAIGKILNVKKD